MSLQEKYGKLQQGQAFASLKYADEFLSSGQLPGIHKDMGVMLERVPENERKGAIDFGACHGLLSIRAAMLGFGPVVGWELDEQSVQFFNTELKPNINLPVRLQVNHADVTTDKFASDLRDVANQGVDTIIARRVLSELFVTTYGKRGHDREVWMAAGHAFGKAARDLGFRRIILEGRAWKQYKTRANPVYRSEVEIEAIGPTWKVVDRYKETAMLVPA